MAFTHNVPMRHNIFEERYGPVHTRNPRSDYFAVHPSDIGFIVGKNGITLKKIERDSGVIGLALVPYTKSYPNTPPHFEIKGNRPSIMNAIGVICGMCKDNLCRQWEKSAKQSEVRNSLTVEREDMKMVIGKKGHTIQGINKKYNVRTFTRTDDKNPDLKSILDINGFGPDVAAAKNHIMNIVYESQHRRGVMTQPDIEKTGICDDKMFQILKEKEDTNLIAKMKRLDGIDTEEAKKEYGELFAMLEKTDEELLGRVRVELS
jgi:predicted RNA-binding protein YlqC (UPF0109 family)